MKAFLSKLKHTDLHKEIKLITLPANMGLEEGLGLLFENNVLSAPVLEVKEGSKKLIGLVDLRDVVAYVLEIYGATKQLVAWLLQTGIHGSAKPDLKASVDLQIQDPEIKELLQAGLKVKQEVAELIDYSGINTHQSVPTSYDLHKIALLLEDHHRVTVVDEQNKCVDIVTQSDLIKLVHKNMGLFPELQTATVEKWSLGFKKVVSINHKEQTIRAFKLQATERVTAVAVVDDNGDLIGNISAHDIRHIDPAGEIISSLLLPCSDFVHTVRKTWKTPENPVVVIPSTSLAQVIKQMVHHHIHRVYIVEKEGSRIPIGIITLTDLIQALVKHLN
eukprot:TRINITY_DN5297_c0_g1_i1.p1 TRINITY_DN5297_c0_g1~~TRINITY_DN5297_c0_g1_i1.p1  ORF type:complete len:333 (+),score=36.75 TRINITY_DN5297_c0_g1_i1:55-1053(+)